MPDVSDTNDNFVRESFKKPKAIKNLIKQKWVPECYNEFDWVDMMLNVIKCFAKFVKNMARTSLIQWCTVPNQSINPACRRRLWSKCNKEAIIFKNKWTCSKKDNWRKDTRHRNYQINENCILCLQRNTSIRQIDAIIELIKILIVYMNLWAHSVTTLKIKT